MAYNSPLGLICYNNSDLIRDGFISRYKKVQIPITTANLNKLKHPRKGTTYQIVRDEQGNISEIWEVRKLLPASKIKIEILFTKTLRNSITNPIGVNDLASIGWLGGGSMFGAGMGILPVAFGGITSGITEFSYHLCDTETKVNIPITITQDIINHGIIELEGYPLSVFGVVKEYTIKDLSGKETKYGFTFTAEELEDIGKFESGAYSGYGSRRDIGGATDDNGLFGGRGAAFITWDKATDIVNLPDTNVTNRTNLFIEVVRDIRKFKFRADNITPNTVKGYPFSTKNLIDGTSNKIKINTQHLKNGDVVYITYCVATNRYLRQLAKHSGSIFQDNGYGLSSKMSEINSYVDLWDYQMSQWYVPIRQPDYTDHDSFFLLPNKTFTDIQNIENLSPLEKETISKTTEMIEGWRLASVVTNKIDKYWAADYRGILLVTKNETCIILKRKDIRDQIWFNDYIKTLPFVKKHKDLNGNIVVDDDKFKIEEEIEFKKIPECLFDLSPLSNSLCFDRHKVPYYKLFAEALMRVSKYDIADKTTGVGIPNMDYAYSIATHKGIDLSFYKLDLEFEAVRKALGNDIVFYDASNSIFKWTKAKPINSYSCEEDFDIIADYGYYSGHTFDAQDGSGVFWPTDVSNLFAQYSSPYIESMWKYETPYLCGDFTSKTRVFTERVGGNALNNWSFVFADTLPNAPHTISVDYNSGVNTSMLSFWDDTVHTSSSIMTFIDGKYEETLNQVSLDNTRNHTSINSANGITKVNFAETTLLGYNKLIGSVPSYSNGCPVSWELSKICSTMATGYFERGYGNDKTNMKLDSEKLTITKDNKVFLRDIKLYYKIAESTATLNRDISIYFPSSDSAITGLEMPDSGTEENGSSLFKIDCRNYPFTTMELRGSILNNTSDWRYESTEFVKELLDYKVQSGQTAVVYDGAGRALIFYSNEMTGNIDVALSYNDGKDWEIYSSILRLQDGEVATFPVVISEDNNLYISLFYILNDSFLMYRTVDTSQFLNEDLWKTYNNLTKYDETTTDIDDDTKPNSQLYLYSESGRALRKQTSYFVEGDAKDTFYKQQTIISKNIEEKNTNSKTTQSIRYQSFNFEDQMTKQYNGNAFTVHVDKKGIKRIFMVEDNKLTIKSSTNFRTWSYDIIGAEVHRDFFAENRGETIVIKNIQIVRNNFEKDTLNLLYFHNGMLFLRVLQSNLIFTDYDNNGIKDDTQVRDYFKITPQSGSKPIFLIGNMTEEIRSNLNQKDSDGNPLLAITFPYESNTADRFNDGFQVDDETQPFGYYVRQGLIRVFYKDNTGYLRAITINGPIPYPEVWYKIKEDNT